jgi:hypothetical protein
MVARKIGAKMKIGSTSKTKKIDVENFTHTEMVARLFSITRNFGSVRSKLLEAGKPEFMKYAQKVVRDNFKYPKNREATLVNNLALFLLGNDKNIFSNLLK